MRQKFICADFGSTFTKVIAVDEGGKVVGSGAAPTTIDTDVMDGFEQAVQLAGIELDGSSKVLAASSAGGGLRLAVVGYERPITAEAGYRVGLSAGARVCHVTSGELTTNAIDALLSDRPDVVLLVGGTDGGNSEVLLHNARKLADRSLAIPVVLAGNSEAQSAVLDILNRAHVSVTASDNVLPKIGVLDPSSARAAIREVFITHVIGGKHLSDRIDLSSWVKAATPDAVLSGVELLADGDGASPGFGDVLVVDVGGATTDVYSVTTPGSSDEDDTESDQPVIAMSRSRTVEGDLGVRWSASGIVDAALNERLLSAGEADGVSNFVTRRTSDPSYVPDDDPERQFDRQLMQWAATVALRRHARPQESAEARYAGKDLRRVRVVVGSGGVLRHMPNDEGVAVVTAAIGDDAGGWRRPERARVIVDRQYVLAAAGLIGVQHPDVAVRLLQNSLLA